MFLSGFGFKHNGPILKGLYFQFTDTGTINGEYNQICYNSSDDDDIDETLSGIACMLIVLLFNE